ncbi:MAG: radical SAM protein [Eubacteriaceae bacterium]|nr:radical SAM protein [Eubacteriaceae bacterium]
MSDGIIRRTRSVCPICLAPINANLVRRSGGAVYMEKSCSSHGRFSEPVWRDKVSMGAWLGSLPEIKDGENLRCPGGCAGCSEHLQGVCCVLLEVTQSCNLQCSFCFANGGAPDPPAVDEPSVASLMHAIDKILDTDDKPLIQFSGGEPTLRDDLPELVSYARARRCRYTQINTNGLRLADDEAYVRALADAGLSIVFLQFDGVDDSVYSALRGAQLYEIKMRAIEMCDKHNIGVTLVPTIVPGVNDNQIGDIVRLGASLSPAVRGIHFQPVSYFGRYPSIPGDGDRFTLDELLFELEKQAGIPLPAMLPSRCDHPLCGFHGSFLANGDKLVPLSSEVGKDRAVVSTASQNREYIGRRWEREDEQVSTCCSDSEAECCCVDSEDEPGCCGGEGSMSLDSFLDSVQKNGFTITGMAFQDAMNLDIERLRRCSLHVYHNGELKPFCAKYLTSMRGGMADKSIDNLENQYRNTGYGPYRTGGKITIHN